MSQEMQLYMPEQAATATGPDGRKAVFFYVPQLVGLIQALQADYPGQVTYRWAHHPALEAHVLLLAWDTGLGTALAIPDEAGAEILAYMQPQVDIYLTVEEVHERLVGDVAPAEVAAIINGRTVGVPDVGFAPLN